jgi:DNA-binding transcriptional LysR family regulator
MDSLDILRIFQRVAELGGFTRAADSLGLPKASVSTAVARLEATLGTQLLHRTTRRVQLTADGQTFYQRSLDLVDDMDELHGMFRQARQLKGRLRVDMTAGLARGYVIPKLPEFLAEHPLLHMEISSTDRIVDLVREGFDCVVRAGAVADSALVARPLGLMPIASCASPAYLARHGTPRTVQDLDGHQLVHYVGTLGQRSPGFEYRHGEGYATRALPGPITVNSGDAYLACALAGLGIIQIPRVGVRSLLDSGALVELLPDAPAEAMQLTLLYPQRRHLPRRVSACMDWLASVLTPHLDPLPDPR